MDKNKEWTFTMNNCKVNDELFNDLIGDSVTFTSKEVKAEPEKVEQPLTVTVKVDVDTIEAEANIERLTEMLSKANEEIEKMKNGMTNFQPKDTFTTNYSNCTFLYGKYGRANVYNECEDIEQDEEMSIEDNECDCNEEDG